MPVPRSVITLAGGILGLIAGYYAGAFFGCLVLLRGSNLCGLPSMITAPLGFVLGLLLARRLTRPARSDEMTKPTGQAP